MVVVKGRHLGRAIAIAYLAGVWIYGVGITFQYNFMPGTASYFLEVAGLFPNAAKVALEYRVEGWVCADKRWEELDYRPYFPLHSDDKENRFQRIMSFFRKDAPTMESLDDFLVEHHATGKYKDGIDGARALGGVRYVSLRVPLPKVGDKIERFRIRPLAEYPKAYRHVYYRTDRETIDERCGTHDAPDSAEVEKPEADKADKIDKTGEAHWNGEF